MDRAELVTTIAAEDLSLTHVGTRPIQDGSAIIHFILLAGKVICWPGSHPAALSAGCESIESLDCNLGCKAPQHLLHFLSPLASWFMCWTRFLLQQLLLELMNWPSQVSGCWGFRKEVRLENFMHSSIPIPIPFFSFILVC